MTIWNAHAGEWLVQIATTARDTVLVKQVVGDPGWFGKVTGIASGLVSIALCLLAAFLIPAAWNFRKSYAKVNDLLKSIQSDVAPIMRHASTVADNVNYISTSIRTDIQQVSRTIESANQRLEEALATSERRVRELNALLRVVQEEAEDTFVSAASAVRGVRAGAATFQNEIGDELTGEDNQFDVQETDDGYDDSTSDTERQPQPRVRPRDRSPRRN